MRDLSYLQCDTGQAPWYWEAGVKSQHSAGRLVTHGHLGLVSEVPGRIHLVVMSI